MSTQSNNILIYGGTFDPIHMGHIQPIIDVSKQLNIHKVIYVPCHIPPHKSSPELSSDKRLSLVKSAISEFNFGCDVEVSDFEITNTEPSFTVNTLAHFKATYPQAKIYFAMGMDSLLNLDRWHKWQEIVEAYQLVVVNRPGYKLDDNVLHPDIAKRLAKSIHCFDSTEVAISSTQLRKFFGDLKEGTTEIAKNDLASYVPDSVLAELLRLKSDEN